MKEPIENGLALMMPQAASKTAPFAIADTSTIFIFIIRASITPTSDDVRHAEISMNLTTTSLIIHTSAAAHLALGI